MLGRDFVRGPGEEVDLRGFSALLGVLEARGCVLLAIRPLSPKLSIVGSLLAILRVHRVFSLHHSRCSESAGYGFPSLLGEFLLKDIPLLGLSFWALADSIRAASRTDSGS
jgi:uncharacterized membrane protein YkgB